MRGGWIWSSRQERERWRVRSGFRWELLQPARGMALDLVAHHEAAEEEMTLDPLPQPLDVLFSGLRS